MKVFASSDELIGNTPLLRLKRIEKLFDLKTELYAKLEYFNPAGSVKDRVARCMIDEAEKSGVLRKGATIIEPTSGNTGIGLAAVGAVRGYKVILVMPETMSKERRTLAAAYGAEIVLTSKETGMSGSIARANELATKIPGAVILGQFTNPSNPKAHYITTAPEIYDALDGNMDIFVACVGTGGTLSGTAKYLKERISGLKAYAVEPASSPVLSGGKPAPHAIQGIGAGFVPDTLDMSVCDGVVKVTDENAYEFTRTVCRHEGILVGISSGAALNAAVELARLPENSGKRIVTLFPDTGERYLSTTVFE